jgi:predicted transcriptional regulator YdeE/DNA-binding transcriptional MerR regulator
MDTEGLQTVSKGTLMIKIGDFSNLAHVSIKTLHHYDELGLLKPAHIDRFSGYRYYTLPQLATLNRILALKDLGLALEQVAQLLHDNISPSEMRGMLRLKRLELATKVDEEQARLSRVESRLRQLEQGDSAVNAEVAIKPIPAQTILTAKIVAANEALLFPARQSLQTLLQNCLNQAQLKPVSPWFALKDNLPYVETDLELTLGVGVNLRSGQRAGDWNGTPVSLHALPAVPSMASVIHAGEILTLPQTYTSLYAWTQVNGYQIAGAFREFYLPETGVNASPTSQLDASLIEVQCPVERASIPLSIISKKDKSMEPKIVTKPAFKAVGFSYIGKNQNDEIGQMWRRFIPHLNEPQRINPTASYGLCFSEVKNAQEGEFEYVAAVEVANDHNIPEGMVYREVPECKYAVFTHHGKLNTLSETYQYIYNTWLPQAKLQLHPSRFDMEYYTEEFLPDSDDSKLYIYVALQ